jgi:hypothetical protein
MLSGHFETPAPAAIVSARQTQILIVLIPCVFPPKKAAVRSSRGRREGACITKFALAKYMNHAIDRGDKSIRCWCFRSA